MNSVQDINAHFTAIYNQLIAKFTDPSANTPSLTRKNLSQLANQVYKISDGSNTRNSQSKDILLLCFQSHATNFINNEAWLSLARCQQDGQFGLILARKWEQFKTIVFTYFTLLMHGRQYYETKVLGEMVRRRRTGEAVSGDVVMPVPVVGARLWKKMVMERLKTRIVRVVMALVEQERERGQTSQPQLTSIMEMMWSCGLGDLARIAPAKNSVTFQRQTKKQFTVPLKATSDYAGYMRSYLLDQLHQAAASHYRGLYRDKIKQLGAIEQVELLNDYCQLEEQIANVHLPTKQAIEEYLWVVFQILTLEDADYLLNRQNGFKHVLAQFSHTEDAYRPQIQLYFKLFTRVEEHIIEKVIKAISEVIAQKGAQINSKIGKPKEHIGEMLHFKKSMRKVFEIVKMKSFKVEEMMEKSFRRLMETIEVSKSLAEYADFTIRECLRLRLGEQECLQKFKDIRLLLNSLSAKDSFLLYHQELLAKRMLDGVLQARTEIEHLFLKMLADNLGNIMVASHSGMVKDIENSAKATQQLTQRLPFLSHKWDLRVFNSAFWPDSLSKIRFTHIEAPLALKGQMLQLKQLYQQHFSVSLRWKLQKGTSLFEGQMKKGKFRFQAQNILMVMLLHIDEQPDHQISFAQIKDRIQDGKTGDQPSPTQNYLKVLIQCKILKRGEDKAVQDPFEPSQIITVNQDYSPPPQHKPAQSIVLRPSPGLVKLFNQGTIQQGRILKDREKLIDAILVKLLKHAHATGNNSITFSQLYQGITNHAFLGNFNFSQGVVKKRLEHLISKQYCERDEQDRKVYHYIA